MLIGMVSCFFSFLWQRLTQGHQLSTIMATVSLRCTSYSQAHRQAVLFAIFLGGTLGYIAFARDTLFVEAQSTGSYKQGSACAC